MPQAAAPTAVRFEHQTDHGPVLGVGTPTPRLSWAIPQAEQGFEQTAYEIELARGEGPPSSVVVESREQVLVPWTAEPLTSRESVQVRVRVRGDAEWSDWSQPTVVTAGLLSVDNWTA